MRRQVDSSGSVGAEFGLGDQIVSRKQQTERHGAAQEQYLEPSREACNRMNTVDLIHNQHENDGRLLDILFREYLPYEPNIDRPSDRDALRLLVSELGELAELVSCVDFLVAAFPRESTVWRVSTQADGQAALGFLWLKAHNTAGVPLELIGQLCAKAGLATPALAELNREDLGIRCDLQASASGLALEYSRLFRDPSKSDAPLRRYVLDEDSWLLCETSTPYFDAANPAGGHCLGLQSPVFDGSSPDLPNELVRLAETADLLSASYGFRTTGLYAIGVHLQEVIRMLRGQRLFATLGQVLDSNQLALGFRSFDVEVQYSTGPSPTLHEVALWGVI